jgi:ubiquitin carboxyl-terminal hydrolase L3
MAEEEKKHDVKKPKWIPIESNPDVCNKYIKNLGWPSEQFCFHELMSTEEWAFGMIPSPVLGILLLFPVTEKSEAVKEA